MDKKQILIVDDTPANISFLKGLLQEQYGLRLATSGMKALALVNGDYRPDLILLDIMMPEMDGYEVCRRLKDNPKTFDIPVIFLTAMDQMEDEKMGLDLGAVDYITKPISPPILLARIQNHLQLKEANDALKNQAVLLEKMVQERTNDLLQLNKVLTKFVPVGFLKAMNKENLVSVGLGDHMDGVMTILFTDIRAYTTLSEKLSHHELFQFLNAYHARMIPIIESHGGFIHQFQGDGALAIFPESAHDAVNAAIAIQEELKRFNRERIQQGDDAILVGIGIHTGPLLVGIIGNKSRWEAGVASDTVNTASRMEGLTKYYGVSIVLSETTYGALENANSFHLRFLDTVKVKGKETPVKVYEVFDGNSDELFRGKLKSLENYNSGQKHYFGKSFGEAVKAFADVLTTIPEDTPAKYYLQRSSKCLLEGATGHWQEVQTMSEK